MTNLITVRAPAKLNLFLHITGRRADGYHTLESVFTQIDLCDILQFQITDDGIISRANNIENLPEAQDLTIRAAHALKQQALRDNKPEAARCGAIIYIEKYIPMGGGLGGGSTDAASTLKTLNNLWNLNYPDTTLAEIGLTLGADVPFFIFGKSAFAQGIGEQLRAVNLPKLAFLVVKPDIHVPTPTVFAAPELTRNTKTLTISDFSSVAGSNVETARKSAEFEASDQYQTQRNDDSGLSFTVADLASFKNDMQDVVVRRYSEVAQALDLLQLVSSKWCAFPARMTGSGACVFAAFFDVEHATIAQQKWQQKVAVSQHPQLARAKTFVVTCC